MLEDSLDYEIVAASDDQDGKEVHHSGARHDIRLVTHVSRQTIERAPATADSLKYQMRIALEALTFPTFRP